MRFKLTSLLCAAALCGCASVSPRGDAPTSTCAQMPPIPAELLKPEPQDFKQRMLNFCCEPAPTPTGSAGSSPKPKRS